jgi:hypothetical protein
MKPKFKTTKAFFTSVWFATIVLVFSDYATAVDIVGDTVQGNLTVTGNSTGTGWGWFKQGIDFGNNGEAMLNWTPGTSPAGTVTFDITWADGTFTWRDTVTTTASNKMSLDAANNLLIYKFNGTAGITLAPETGKITLPAGNGTSTGSGIYFGTSTAATLAASATGAAIFPSQVTLQNGLSISSGNMNIASTTPSTSSATGALTVAGGLGVSSDSWINGVRVGRGANEKSTNTVLGSNSLGSTSSISGDFNTAVGSSALLRNTTGNQNVALGSSVLYSNIVGRFNTAVGTTALYYNLASNNNAFGHSALLSNTTGILNCAFGDNSLGQNKVGNNNIGIGPGALYYNGTTGSADSNSNIGIGLQALVNKKIGSNNVAVGNQAAIFQANGTTNLETTQNSIYIGSDSRGYNDNDNNSIVIGYQAIGEGANTTVIGNTSTVKTRLHGETNTSSLRVFGATALEGKVIISVPQGDISMGIYQ